MTTSRVRATFAISSALLSAFMIANAICSCLPAIAQVQSVALQSPAPEAQADSSLKNIGSIARRIRIATLDIINDVEQRKLAVVSGDPLFLDPPAYSAKDSAVWAKQVQELGPLETPKQQWLEADVANLGKWIAMLNSEFGSTAFGADKTEAVNPTWTEMNGLLADINSHYKNLQQLSAGPSLDNIAIGGAALKVHDDVRKLQHPWKQTLDIVQQGQH